MYIIQSINFDTNKLSFLDAASWLMDNNFKITRMDEIDGFYKFRQKSSKSLKLKGYTLYKIKKLGNGIEFIIAYKQNIEYNTI